MLSVHCLFILFGCTFLWAQLGAATGPGAGSLLRSQSAQSGPPPRPSNLPRLRAPSSNAAGNSGNSGIGRKRSHVLTPFDYPISNPVIGRDLTVNHDSHAYYRRYTAKIKEEKESGSSSTNSADPDLQRDIHSALLYSVHALPEGRGTAQSASATPTPRHPQQSQHFSLSTALLQIPQHQRPAVTANSC